MINIFRKKNKLTAFLALTAAILMLCTGCVRSGVGITIEPNDTGTVEISVGINENYLETLKEYSESENPFAGEDTVTVTDGDDKYICTVEKKTFKKLEELKTILLELEYNFESLEDEGFSMDDDTLDFDSEDDGDDNVWVTSDGEVIPLDEDTDEEEDNYRMAFVANCYRPLTRTPIDALEVMREIEAACGLKFTDIVNNSHLGNFTDVQTLLDSQSFVQELSELSGLPVFMTTVRRDLHDAVSKHIPNVFPLQLQEKYFDLPDQRI